MASHAANPKDEASPAALPLTRLNHISLNCTDVEPSLHFYRDVLGFSQIKRPGFDFDGAWLFKNGTGIHLVKDDKKTLAEAQGAEINPKDEHISFQCCSMEEVERSLREHDVEYKRQQVQEDGLCVDQLFFHDPDNHMIEVCNCDVLPVLPLEATSFLQEGQELACPCLTSLSSAENSASTQHDSDGGDSVGHQGQCELATSDIEMATSKLKAPQESKEGVRAGQDIQDDVQTEWSRKEKVLHGLDTSMDSQGPIPAADPQLSNILEKSAQVPENKRKRDTFAICA